MVERKTRVAPFQRTYPSGKTVWVAKATDGFDRRIPFSELKMQQYQPISDDFAKQFITERFSKTHPDAINTGRITFLHPNKLWQTSPNKYDVLGLDAPNIPIYNNIPFGFGIPGQIIQVKSQIYVCANDGLFHEVQKNDYTKFKEPGVSLVSTDNPKRYSYAYFVNEINDLKSPERAIRMKKLIKDAFKDKLITKEQKDELLLAAEDKQKDREHKRAKRKESKKKKNVFTYDQIQEHRNEYTRIIKEMQHLEILLDDTKTKLSPQEEKYFRRQFTERKAAKLRLEQEFKDRNQKITRARIFGEEIDKDFLDRAKDFQLQNAQLRMELKYLNEKRTDSNRYSFAQMGVYERQYQEAKKHLEQRELEEKVARLFPKYKYYDELEVAKVIRTEGHLPVKVVNALPSNLKESYNQMLDRKVERQKKERKAMRNERRRTKAETLVKERARNVGTKKLLESYESFFYKNEVTDVKEDVVAELGEMKGVMDLSRIKLLTTPELFENSPIDKATKYHKTHIPNDFEGMLYYTPGLDEVLIEPKSKSMYHKRFFDKSLKAMDKRSLQIYTNAKENTPLILRDKDYVVAVAPRYVEDDDDDDNNGISDDYIKATPEVRQRIKEINKISKAQLVEKLPYVDKKFTLKQDKKSLVFNELLYELKPEIAKKVLSLK